ncbi:MAG TPA: CBS domain-containing protein [Polyangiales bacterium]
MDEPSSATRHSIAFLHVVGSEGESHSGHVLCPRMGGSVPLERCARCPRFVKVTPGAGAGHEAVHCHAGPHPPAPTNKPLSLARTAVADLMTRNVVCVRPELSLDAVTTLFLETSLAAIPVVDDVGRLLGFVGQEEVTLAAQVAQRSMTVGDVLMPFAIAVPETTSVTQAAAVMAFEGQHRLAVTSTAGAVIGVLAASDILYWLARADGHVLPPPRLSCRP